MKNFFKKKSIYFILIFIISSCSQKEPEPIKSSAKSINSFAFNNLIPTLLATIDSTNLTITAIVPTGTDLTKLVPTIEISDKATISPASGVAQDFSNGNVNYTVTAEDGSKQSYAVQIIIPKAKIENNLIIYFGSGSEITSLNAQNGKDPQLITKFKQCCSQGSIPLTYVDGVLLANDYYGDLFAIDSKSGKTLWTFAQSRVNSSQPPLIDNNKVYYSSFSGLYALDIKTGNTIWLSTDTRGILSSPTISEGTIYIGTTQSLSALNANDGKEKWEFYTTSGENYFARPTVGNQIVYIGNTNGNFYAIDAKTGKEKWKFKTGDSIWSTAKVINGVVYFGSSDSYFYALDAETGKMKWRFLADGPISSSPSIENGAVYFTGKSSLYSLRLSDGVKNLTYDITINSEFMSPVIANGVIYLSTAKGYLRAVNAYTGEILWEYPRVYTPVPIILGKDGKLFVSGENGSK